MSRTQKIVTAVNNPTFLIRVHASMMLFFFVLAFPSAFLWSDSVTLIIYLSVWALIAGHWAAYQAVYAQREEQQDNDVDFDELDQKVDDLAQRLEHLIALVEDNQAPEAERCL